MTTTKTPVHEIRCGGVKASIWRNGGEHGDFHAVTFSRSYRDGEAWKTTGSYRFAHLLALAFCVAEAQVWIFAAERKAAAE